MEESETVKTVNKCKICNCSLNFDVVMVGKKGLERLCFASESRQDGLFANTEQLINIRLHKKCRKSYTNPKLIEAASKKLCTGKPPESLHKFDFTTTCFFCSGDVSNAFVEDEKKKSPALRVTISKVQSEMTKTNIIIKCTNRSDQWSYEVLERISNVNLQTEGARYHRRCFALFFNSNPPTTQKRGRPTSIDINEQMLLVYNYLENHDDSQHTIDDIKDVLNIKQINERTMIRKLKEKYDDGIVISSSRGRKTIVCFVTTCQEILRENWYTNRNTDKRIEKLRIVQTAATIVRNEIRSSVYENSTYPAPSAFLENIESCIPETLMFLLNSLLNESEGQASRKKIALAHVLISLLRPRSFKSSLLLGLGCLIHQKYASKYIIDLLSSLGFSATYNDVLVFEASAIAHPQPTYHVPDFVQFSYDNADFNVQTLDGLNTFHAMGGIQCNTPVIDNSDQQIVRLTKIPSSIIMGHYGHIPIKKFHRNKSSTLKDKIIQKYYCDGSILPTVADCLWLYAKSQEFPDISGWSSFMETITKTSDFSVSEIKFLPFINSPPSEYDTVYTSLKEAAEICQKAGKETCIVTFDQPLYQKAQEILHTSSDEDLKKVVLRLGGFHLLMSYLGTIGFIMKDSGLRELWSCIYATNSIDKMLGGHSYSRAVRANTLTNATLFKMINENICLSLDDKLEIETALENHENGDCHTCDAITTLREKLDHTLTTLRSNGPTAQLWVQYFEMTTLMKKFIESERTGNWNLHLETIKHMLPFFYASGHFHYAKCASMYLDDMHKLQQKMTTSDYAKFTNGLFTIRRTKKFWSGVWSDLTIEQTLMRSMKSIGGLTHGRGVSDSVLSKWILSLPVVQKVSEKVEDFCKVESNTCDQHMDSTASRIKRDTADMTKLINWLRTHEPFRVTDKLICISKGIVGNDQINCHKAREVGRDMMLAKVGTNYNDVKFSRKERVTTLQHMTASVKISNGENVAIDSDLIMRRISFNKQSQEDLKTFFEYELAPYPLALFDGFGMRKTKKSSLYDLFEPLESVPDANVKLYVVDGGYLLNKVIWQKGMTFRQICERYINYIKHTFDCKCIIVFDGYQNIEGNTKNAERARRTQGKTYVEILFDENTVATVPQDQFLGSEKNKERLISMLRMKLENATIRTFQSDDDADTLIISKAIQEADFHELVLVVGEDVDLLVILTTYPNSNIYLMKPGRGKIPTRFYGTNSLIDTSMKEHILFIHAVSGCDTTSALYRVGKKKCASILKKDIELKHHLKIFNDPEANATTIERAGEKFLSKLYGGSSKNLNMLRYERFAQATLKSSFNMANLPPTLDAARQHFFRVYHQIQKWLNNDKVPTQWGWKKQEDILIPIQKTLDAAPPEILHMISCRCKLPCNRNCTCKKCGLKCSELCVHCTGKECLELSYNNVRNIDSSDEEDSNEVSNDLNAENTAIEDDHSNIEGYLPSEELKEEQSVVQIILEPYDSDNE